MASDADVAGRAPEGASSDAARRVALAAPCVVLALGAVFGGVTWLAAPALGLATLAACGLAGLGLLVATPRVRRVSRWTAAASLTAALAFAILPTVAAVAFASRWTDAWTLLWATLGLAVVAGVVWSRGVRRRAAEWDAARAANEGQVLDLDAATYDAARGFAYEARAGRADPEQKLRWAASAAAFGATLASGLRGPGGGDFREVVLAALAPVVLLGFLPAAAIYRVTYQKLGAYERLLGRAIVNR